MTLHDLTGALKITGVPEAAAEINEDGSYHIKLTSTVAGETGFKGSLAIEIQNATEPVSVKKSFTGEDEMKFICWLMENGIAECVGMEQDENSRGGYRRKNWNIDTIQVYARGGKVSRL